MATLGALVTQIAKRLQDEDNTAVAQSDIREAVNEAISFWKPKRFWFNERAADISFTEDASELTLPADFLIPLPRNPLTVIENGFPYQVVKKIPLVFDAMASTSSSGRPRIFVFRQGGLEFQPVADRDYDGKIYYLKEYDAFETEDDSDDESDNDFTVNAAAMIRNQALAWLFGELRHDEERETRYTARALSEYDRLLGRTNQMSRSGSLTVEQ